VHYKFFHDDDDDEIKIVETLEWHSAERIPLPGLNSPFNSVNPYLNNTRSHVTLTIILMMK